MGGQKFQYDETGSTFVYFLLSFLALILIPSTYYTFTKKKKEGPEKAEKCDCAHCQNKQNRLVRRDPWQTAKQLLVKFLIIFGWVLFCYVAYKTSQYDYEYANFDPYEILQIERGATPAAIKRAYHKLSLVHHPDKETGDEKAFMRLTKAYQALTDEVARRNWENHGHPDGPGAISFGIALPSWIVEKENSIWVLGLYALLFMVALPVTVGTWWYRSIRYSGDQVLLDTTQMYYYFFHKTPHMVLKRTLMILGASAEFHRRNNPEILERPSDNIEVPQLMKRLPQLNEKNKERPLCFPYSIKARTLLHAHLTRLGLPAETLEVDRIAVIKKCPTLIQEMVVCVSQLIMLGHAGRLSRMPSLLTLEGCMKLSAMIVQGLWDYKSPLLQLPHITEDNLKYFSSKRHQVRSLEHLARLKNDDRRSLLNFLNESQYKDLVLVLGSMPSVEMNVKCEVVDDEATTVYTAGAIVTVTVELFRKSLECYFEKEQLVPNGNLDHGEGEREEEEEDESTANAAKKKVSPWQRNVKKGKKPAGKQKNKKVVKPVQKKDMDEKKETIREKNHIKNDDDSDEDSDDESEEMEEEEETKKSLTDDQTNDKDDDQLLKLQNDVALRRQRLLEGKSQISHSVHCPHFPVDKQEYWWVYISDRKQQILSAAPYHVTNLVEREEIQLRFTAPLKPGYYTFTVCLRSDSYLGFDQMKDIKMDVKEAPEVPTEHPQWDISDEEENDHHSGDSESELATDDDVDDDTS